ncbi:MAG: aldo/keto reductase [Hyphomicrobium sp.]|jgi:aryl-alcohol dehydrogenase-like predicted oxidoreductase
MNAQQPNAAASGQFVIGDMTVNRLGFGAMRITGQGIMGEPADREEATRVLRRVPELGINFIDTAHAYGPLVSERLIRETLYPYVGRVIATKGGLERPGPDRWVANGSAEFLRECVESSLGILGVERIDLWQLHRIDPKIPREAQFETLQTMQSEGLIRHIGLSEVSVDDIKAAERYFPVVTVQNLYNLANRSSEPVLDYCEERGIGFIPWFPLAAGSLARPGAVLDSLARSTGATPGQIALAWLLKRSPVMLPIPGTGKVRHLEENTAAAGIRLSDAEFHSLDCAARADVKAAG